MIKDFFLGGWVTFYLFTVAHFCFPITKKRMVVFFIFLAFSFLNAINFAFCPLIPFSLFYFLLGASFVHFLFSIDFPALFFFCMILYCIRFLFEELFYFTLFLFRISFPTSKILFVCSSIMTLLFSIIFKDWFKEKTTRIYFFNTQRKKRNYFLANLILVLILFIRIPKYQITKNFIPVLLFLFLFNLLLLLLNEKEKNSILEENYKKTIEYSEFTEDLLFEYKSLLHEYKNRLLAIKGLAKSKNKELHEYLNSILNEKTINNYRWLTEIKTIPITGIKGIVNFKLLKMKDLGINIEVYISDEISKLSDDFLSIVEKKDLYTVLGILLDNALEGSLESKEKSASFQLYQENDCIILLIANTFKSVQIDRIEDKGFSSKGKNRGNGLYILNETLKYHERISKETSIANNFFVQKIFIQNK